MHVLAKAAATLQFLGQNHVGIEREPQPLVCAHTAGATRHRAAQHCDQLGPGVYQAGPGVWQSCTSSSLPLCVLIR